MDLHVSFIHRNLRADYRICATAAANFLSEWKRRHGSESITIDIDTDLSPTFERMPCERLFLHP